MIIVNLKGGTGNQMFQYACGRALSLKNKDVLKLDTAGLDRANVVGDIYRPLALDAFNIIKEVASNEEIKKLKYPYSLISKGLRYLSFKLSKDKNTLFNPKVLAWAGDIYLDGYWQSPRYFDDIREVLLKELTLAAPLSPKAEEFAKRITGSQAVSLHVRRGDYAKNPKVLRDFGICSTKYYKQAMAQVTEKVSSPTYFVFSDDIDWVKQNLPVGENAVYVKGEGITDVEELVLMSLCQHNIIANSSFSWWGAWLNQNKDKTVIAPTPWFDTITYDTNLIPDTWIQLPK